MSQTEKHFEQGFKLTVVARSRDRDSPTCGGYALVESLESRVSELQVDLSRLHSIRADKQETKELYSKALQQKY